jgi:uncharacterized membrane protein YphA (DoxX/SURF4 family)
MLLISVSDSKPRHMRFAMQTQPKGMTIAGWVLTVFIAGMLTFSAIMKFQSPQEMIDEFVGRLGYPDGIAVYIGVAELASAILFLIPRTSVLGAVLLTGYLGGAIATHVRINDPFYGPAIGGVLVWLALFLREPRIRAVLPLMQSNPNVTAITTQNANRSVDVTTSQTVLREVKATYTEVEHRQGK